MKKLISAFAALSLCASAFALTPVFEQTYSTSKGQAPFEISIPVPDGNYLVTVTLGDKKLAGETTVKAESRRLCLYNEATAKGEFKTLSFVVNKRDTHIREGGEVVADVTLKPRENGKLNWDDNLTLEIGGAAPLVSSITVEPAEDVTTVFLCGDSTVVDQDNEPWSSWGQMAPCFFDETVAIANYAESGERLDTFRGAGRLRKALSVSKPGDWFFIEFGHNDMKLKGPGKGGYYFFATELKTFIDLIREKDCIPVLVTPTHRRNFDADGHIVESHGDYPDGMRWVAAMEDVDLLDLHEMSALFYEALGPEKSTDAFVHYKAGAYPVIVSDTADNTHFNMYGAYELAKCVLKGICELRLPLAGHIVCYDGFDPCYPDDPDTFVWHDSPYRDLAAQKLEKDDAATIVK